MMDKKKLIEKIDKLIAKAKHECTMSGNVDAQRYLKALRSWVVKNF